MPFPPGLSSISHFTRAFTCRRYAAVFGCRIFHRLLPDPSGGKSALITNCCGGKFGEARHGEIGFGLREFDRAYARPRRWTTHPDRGQSESLCGNHIMVDALADVENAVGGGVNAAESQFEQLQ